MNATAANYLTIEPRLMPREPVDAAVGLAIGMIQLAVLVMLALVPAAAASWITQNPLAVVATFAVTVLVVLLAPQLLVVQRLRCDEEGLAFVKVFGRPRKVRWSDVQAIEGASRAEVVLRGWLFPFFPPVPEMTATLTSAGHYKIRWQGGIAYFPPRDVARFVYAMQVGWGCAARQLAAGPRVSLADPHR